jgi:alpha-galactosidase
MFVSMNKSEAIVAWFNVMAQPNPPIEYLRLKGLDPNRLYEHVETGNVFGGDELMSVGITIPMQKGDFTSVYWRFMVV